MSLPSSTLTLWHSVRNALRELFPADVFQTWFEPMQCVGEDAESVVLSVPSDFAQIWVEDNYKDILTQRFTSCAGRPMDVVIQVQDAPAPPPAPPQGRRPAPLQETSRRLPADAPLPPSGDPLYVINPKNTFDNFVVGEGNRMAHAACMAVADNPARSFNPLFIYGQTGLGKTHLMHAVAHKILHANPQARIAYISTEKFTNGFIRAIQENALTQFRRRYRRVDALLIDDIHFLSGKESTQEEFFHTFNELFEAQKQIILSSDRPVNEIAKLESRLVSRFQWGMVADIQAPDFETRMAILSKKAKAMHLDVGNDILQFLAERVSRNVRRLEGALTRVATFSAVMGEKLDVPTCERMLQDLLQEEAKPPITIEIIQKRVADYYQLRLADMTSKRRPAKIAFPRQIAMYLSRMLTSKSLQEIGDTFGGRDHGTVLHAVKTVENMMEQDASTRRAVEYLQRQLAEH